MNKLIKKSLVIALVANSFLCSYDSVQASLCDTTAHVITGTSEALGVGVATALIGGATVFFITATTFQRLIDRYRKVFSLESDQDNLEVVTRKIKDLGKATMAATVFGGAALGIAGALCGGYNGVYAGTQWLCGS